MEVGKKRDRNGNDNINDPTARIMELANNVRRRSSATFNDKPSTSDGINEEERSELLKDGDGDSQHLDQDIEQRAKGGGSRRQDCSRLLRPFSILFAILAVAIIAFASSDTLLRSSHLHLEIFNFFHIGSDEIASFHRIGIELHPTNHVFRSPKTITHHWIITSGFLSPDGVKKEVYLVNGEFPGPTIQCRSGDKLVIHVTNSLSEEGVSIHWHGLKMRYANSMDGAVGFTQCPIPSGQKFTYEFDIDDQQSGTYWWHAHSQVQRGDGMYGGLVVHRPAGVHSDMDVYGYKNEMLFLIGDWYHRIGAEVLSWYTSVKGFGNEPVPDSLLVNGAGKFLCSMAVPARPVYCEDIGKEQILGIPKGPTRIRVVNVGTLAGFTIGADSGSLTPIMVDGGNAIEGYSAESVGIIYPGERVDSISKWESASISPQLRISLDRENFKYPNPALRPDQSFAVFSTANSRSSPSSENSSYEEPLHLSSGVHFDLASASSKSSAISRNLGLPVPNTSQQTILLYTKTQKLSINANHPQGVMNRTSWVPQAQPLLSLPRTSWDENQLIPFIPSNTSEPIWVDIILNNLDDGAHPFHLHGHDFYVLASHRSEHGWGSYSPWAMKGSASIAPILNLENPALKDTVSIPRRGFVVLRFQADNPGIWMFHCHVLFHQGSGMAMGLHVGPDEEHNDIIAQAAEFCTST